MTGIVEGPREESDQKWEEAELQRAGSVSGTVAGPVTEEQRASRLGMEEMGFKSVDLGVRGVLRV